MPVDTVCGIRPMILVDANKIGLEVGGNDSGNNTNDNNQIDDNKIMNLSVSGQENYDYAYEVLEIVNETRTKLGYNALSMDKSLLETAMQRAAEISIYYSHTRPNDEECFSLFRDSCAKGENIAMGQPTCEYVTEDWKETEYKYDGQGHRRNMLGRDFNCVGIAGFEYKGYIYWVQAFGLKDNIFYNESRTSYEPAGENNQQDGKNNSGGINITYDDDKYDVDIHFDDPSKTDPNDANSNKSGENNPTNTDSNAQENTDKNNANQTSKDKAKTKKSTKITAKKATFKAKTKTKKYTITLKSGKKALNKVKVYLKIKGKTYTAKTKKGKATFKIKKLNKKGKYKATIQFKGNSNYKATIKKVTIKIK